MIKYSQMVAVRTQMIKWGVGVTESRAQISLQMLNTEHVGAWVAQW